MLVPDSIAEAVSHYETSPGSVRATCQAQPAASACLLTDERKDELETTVHHDDLAGMRTERQGWDPTCGGEKIRYHR